jgi:hypothetical protein
MLGSIVEAMSPYPENVRAMNTVADGARARARQAVAETSGGVGVGADRVGVGVGVGGGVGGGGVGVGGGVGGGGGRGELEMDAAQYLAAHVAQVKLEAAECEFAWSTQVDGLRVQNRDLLAQVTRLERVVKENSLQWRLRERDDWKNLVSAVRKDRDRLDSDNAKLLARVASLERQLTTNGIKPLEMMSPKIQKKNAPSRSSRGRGGGTAASSQSSGDGGSTDNMTGESGGTTPDSPSAMTSSSSVHPSSDDVPHATMMRFKELEAQLADSISREDGLRDRLRASEKELQSWKVEKQTDWINQIGALQSKLNMELEQKWARNRGHRPLTSPSRSAARPGVMSRLLEVVAPYPSVESDYDEQSLKNLARALSATADASATLLPGEEKYTKA